MKKRISLVNECTLLCEVVFVLTDSQREKLESGKLRDKVDNIAMDMHICWSVETNKNEALGLIGRECGPVLDSDTMHQIEIDATNFMSAIEKLELKETNEENSDLIDFSSAEEDPNAFLKDILKDIEKGDKDGDAPSFCNATLMWHLKPMPIIASKGQIGRKTFIEMIKCYLKYHDYEYK